MATARKTPAKRAASGSSAATDVKSTRRALVKTPRVAKPSAKAVNGSAHFVMFNRFKLFGCIDYALL